MSSYYNGWSRAINRTLGMEHYLHDQQAATPASDLMASLARSWDSVSVNRQPSTLGVVGQSSPCIPSQQTNWVRSAINRDGVSGSW